jgi:hypothetical protein
MMNASTKWAVGLVALAFAAGPALAQSKKELVSKVLLLQQPALEGMARNLAEQPAAQLAMQARQYIQNVPTERREAVVKAIDADLKKYTDEAVPLLRERVIKLAPTTIGPELETNFSEEELKQVIGWLESPVIKRFQTLSPTMQRSLAEKLVSETRGQIEPKLKTLENAMAKHLGLPPPGSAPAGGGPGAAPAPAPAPGTGAAGMPGVRGADPKK